MGKKGLDQYRGRLTPAQIAEGMNAALSNAKRLADAAALLLEKGHCPLGASVAALSIEEAGKLSVLRSLAVARNDQDVAQCWREYRSHTKKNAMWVFPQLFAQGARRLDDFGSLFDEGAEHPSLLDQVKQIGFYTDCLGKGHWSVPTEVIDKDLSNSLVRTAALLAKGKEVTDRKLGTVTTFSGLCWRVRWPRN
jgi:AbiV family abortive infection protein